MQHNFLSHPEAASSQNKFAMKFRKYLFPWKTTAAQVGIYQPYKHKTGRLPETKGQP